MTYERATFYSVSNEGIILRAFTCAQHGEDVPPQLVPANTVIEVALERIALAIATKNMFRLLAIEALRKYQKRLMDEPTKVLADVRTKDMPKLEDSD